MALRNCQILMIQNSEKALSNQPLVVLYGMFGTVMGNVPTLRVEYEAKVRVEDDTLVMDDGWTISTGTLSDSGMELVWDNGSAWYREVWFTLELITRRR